MKIPGLIFIFSFIISSCATTEALYLRALQDAAVREPDEVSSQLLVIDATTNYPAQWKMFDGEMYLLMIAWKADTTRYKNDSITGFYNTDSYPIFVTLAPELIEWISIHGKEVENDTLRLKQLLGLPPNSVKNYFVEFWVRPQDIFRPCPDAETTDISCALEFPATASCDHMVWYTDFRAGSFAGSEPYQQYPFTGLGYTYDWCRSNKSHMGLSEFVIAGNKNVKVGSFYTTETYLHIPDGN